MPALFWDGDNGRTIPVESLFFTKKVGNTLAMVYCSYDTNGSRNSCVVFFGDDAEAVTRAWHEFVKVKCFGSDYGTSTEAEEIHLNTRMMEVLKMFAEQYRPS